MVKIQKLKAKIIFIYFSEHPLLLVQYLNMRNAVFPNSTSNEKTIIPSLCVQKFF